MLTAATLKRLDEGAVAAGIPLLLLMEEAGRVCAEELLAAYPDAGRILVLAGKGNNGGDALAAARFLAASGREVVVLADKPPAGGAPAEMLRALRVWGVTVGALTPDRARAAPADVVLDGIVGTGLSGALKDRHRLLVEAVNARGQPVLAIDLPSGVASDTGAAGVAISATLTIALTALKPGHLIEPGRSLCGRTIVRHIGIPPDRLEATPGPELLTPALVASWIPDRPRDAHKGEAGRVLVAGGSPAYPGAPALAARGALASGAGLVTVATLDGVPDRAPPEATRLPGLGAEWSAGAGAALAAFRADVIVAGMGMGPGAEGTVLNLLERWRGPLVLDADALSPQVLELASARRAPVVLTPHLGEAARLLEAAPDELRRAPLEALARLAATTTAVVVLKGSPTLVGQGERVLFNPTGNAGMATGGTGDVLAGIIGGLIGQGAGALEAAGLAVFLHGLAGDRAARVSGVGLVASDLVDEVAPALADISAGRVPFPF
jgi:NAD(P)H-hydrate epimerase